MRVPGNGLANAHGLYQFVLVRVLAAQVMLGLDGSGVPPGVNGFRTRVVRAIPSPPGEAVVTFGVTLGNGFPVCAANVKLDAQPPRSASSHA